MKFRKLYMSILLTLPLVSTMAVSAPIDVVDFDSLLLGAKITGPVGPDVEVSLVNEDGDSIGDLRSSVSCPAGFSECVPANNGKGTIYTYSHTLIPGIDLPNDAPFPNPVNVLPFDDVVGFSLGFAATGFNGVAGYSLSEALSAGVDFSIDLSITNELTWLTSNTDWDTGEGITFFWQSTQAPSGPGGTYSINNEDGSGSGAGPIPMPIEVNSPFSLLMFFSGILYLGARTRNRNARLT